MNIRIKRLTADNFKCFRHREFDFKSDIVTVRGRNGAGKTTIADAILWCLFGKNTAGQSDLELFKTRERGEVIPHLEHSVEILLDIDGREVSLRRAIREVWVKKRGSEDMVFKSNTAEYFVDGDSYTAADYKRYIGGIVAESTFRAITNPQYFPNLKWQEQREFLSSLAGEIPTDEVASDKELAALVAILQPDETVESYGKHLSYQIKQLKDKLLKLPIRLEEQTRALPEKQDWKAVSTTLSGVEQQIDALSSQLMQARQGDTSDIRHAEIKAQIAELQRRADAAEGEATRQAMAVMSERRREISEAAARFNEAIGNQRLIEQAIEADNRLMERCRQTVEDDNQSLSDLRSQWPTQKFEIAADTEYCPTCSQPLPVDMLQKRIESMRTAFNQRKEEKKRSLSAQASRLKENIAKAEEEIKLLERKKQMDEKNLDNTKQLINTLFAEKARMEKQPVVTAESLLTDDYHALTKQIKQLTDELTVSAAPADDAERITRLEGELSELQQQAGSLRSQLAGEAHYNRIMGFISDIRQQQKDLSAQLALLEQREDLCKRYQFRQNELLESRVNAHFRLVRWKMFRTVNNSGDPHDDPYCECYVDGVAYHEGLNQAARLNAGLDIINSLCRNYSVSAPIVLDNAESTINIIETEGQQIRLFVEDTDLNIG